MAPPDLMMRWQGMITAILFLAQALPAALTAAGLPARYAKSA
jgi:hypothetical protein